MRRRTKALIATAVTVVVLGALGAGAYALIDTVNGSFHIGPGAAAAAATRTPTAAPTPLDEEAAAKLAADKASKGLAVGSVLTADQAKTIAHYWQGTLLPYKMSDGTQVLIAHDQPLPENVLADAGRLLAAAADHSEAAQDTANGLVITAEKSLEFTTGHKVTVVFRAFVALAPAFERTGRAWITDALGGDTQFSTADQAVAAARAAVGPDATIIIGQ